MNRSRQFLIGGLLLTVGLVGGCSSEQELVRPDTGARIDPCSITVLVSENKAPKWITQKGATFSGDRAVFYGVGNIAGTRNSALRRRASEQAARADIAKTFNTYIANMQKQYLASTTAGSMDKASEEQHVEEVMKALTEQTLNGADVVEYWDHPCVDRNEAYSLARLDLVRFTEMVNQLGAAGGKWKELDAKIKAAIKENANKLHSEMSAELEKRRDTQQ